MSPNLSNGEHRSRSPTPRLKKVQNLAPEKRHGTRSRSPTLNRIEHSRSRSGTPTSHKKKNDKKDRSFVASNKDLTMHFNDDGTIVSRSRSPSVGRSSLHNSLSSPLVPNELPKQVNEELMSRADSFKDKYNEEQVKRLEELIHQSEKKNQSETSGVDYSPTHRVSDNFKGTSQYYLLNSTPVDELERSTTSCMERGGIDSTPACKVSENFVGTSQYHLLNTNPVKESRRSVSPCRERSGVDTTPACKVSENFGRVQYHTSNLPSPKMQLSKERSGVDTTPVSKVSENFISGTRSQKSSASVNDLDLITKKEQNDSGSEVSDEGYKSLGLVTTPPANTHQTTVPPLSGK